MPISRRSFLKSGTFAAISAGLVGRVGPSVFGQKRTRGSGVKIPIPAQRDLLYYAKRETFEPYVGSTFRARGAHGEILDLTLVRVSTYKPDLKTKISTRSAPETDSFSLIFSAPGQLPAFSNMPALYHAAFGKLEMLLTSHGEVNGVFFYEAVVNHIR